MPGPPPELAPRKPQLSPAKQALLQQRLQRARPATDAIPVAPRSTNLPLSFAQERLWFLDRLIANRNAYNVPCLLRITGPLDTDALAAALNTLIARHEILRTAFPEHSGVPNQVVLDVTEWSVPVFDVSAAADPEGEASARLRTIASETFDLAHGPLVRAAVVRLSENEHWFALVFHHIVADGWSMGIIKSELVAAYQSAISNQPHSLPPLRIQYGDFAAWQRMPERSARLETELAYWRDRLDGAPPVLELPASARRPAVQTLRGERVQFQLHGETAANVRALGQAESASPYMVLLAAFNLLLMRYTGRHDLVVGTPVSGRIHPDLEPLLGCFVNTVVIRSDLSGTPTFRELVRRTRQTALEAFEHQQVPFERVVEALHPQRDLSYEPVCQVMFTYREAAGDAFDLAPGTHVEVMPNNDGVAKFDLVLSISENKDGMSGSLDYNADIYSERLIKSFVDHFQTFLRAALQEPDAPAATRPMLSEAAYQQIIFDWNATESPYPDNTTFHALFEAVAANHPELPAVVVGQTVCTYADLNARANTIATSLLADGLAPGTLVALCMNRGLNAVAAALGVIKARGAFLPLDPSYPRERIAFMLDDSRASIILTDDTAANAIPDTNAAVHRLEAMFESADACTNANPDLKGDPRDLAYAIYTSGSTGKPKAALMEHRGLCNLAAAQRALFELKPDMRVLQFAPLSFDAWVWEVAMTLSNGATLCIADDLSRAGEGLGDFIDAAHINLAVLPPSVIGTLPDRDYPTLQALISGGEACSEALVKRWQPGRQFLNAYGPTEATVCCAFHRCAAADDSDPPIGRPLPNVRLYVLDAYQQPVPIGVEGELYVGGVGVGRGYLNRPELTVERFLDDPFSNAPAAHMYRSGDRVRRREDGALLYVGRDDHQVKVRGFRIELGEIESVLRAQSGVADVVCVVDKPNSAEARIAAYIEPVPGASLTEEAIRASLRECLPGYMTPSVFHLIEALPRTPNGKADRKALAESISGQSTRTAAIPPRNDTERRIAAVWADVLEVECVGVEDNFFDAGGHSLLAVKLAAKLNEAGFDIPLQRIFQSPTVAAMAASIDESGATAESSSTGRPAEEIDTTIVPIQPRGNKPALFVIAPAGGVVYPYFHLARLLNSEQPIIGLQDPAQAGAPATPRSVQDYAALYLKAMRRVQPHGPYHLLGWSFAGCVAYEIAQQLEREGEPAGLLCLVDTRVRDRSSRGVLSAIRHFTNQAVVVLGVTISVYSLLLNGFYLLAARARRRAASPGAGWAEKIKQQWASLWMRAMLRKSEFAHLIPEDSQLAMAAVPTFAVTVNILRLNSAAGIRYKPERSNINATLIRAGDHVMGESHDAQESYGWDKLVNDVRVHTVPGNHAQMFTSPNVEVLAEVLQAELDRFNQLS